MITTRKIIAIVLTVLTIMSIMSVATPVFAAEITDIANSNMENVEETELEESGEKEPEILNEVVEWRTESTKYFRNSDGSYTAAQYAYPVHYKENGEWKEIDNTLSEEAVGNNLLNAEKEFVAKNTNTPAKFPDEFRQDGSKEITVSAEGYDISFSPKANQKGLKASNGDIKDREDLDSVKIVEKFNDKKEEKTSSFKATNLSKKAEIEKNKEEKFKVENKSGAIVYEDVFNSVDLEYELNNSQIKESIVLEEKQDEYVFEFDMDLGELHPVICEDGSINLCSDEEGKEIVAKIEAPYMVDSNGEYSEAVTMTIAENGKEYILTVVADEKWLNDESRAYPVVIDPTIDLNINRKNVIDNYIDDSEASESHPYAYNMYAGYNSWGKTRTYIKFNLPDLPDDNCIITGAFIAFYQESVDKGSTDGYLTIHEVTKNWNNTDSSLLPTWNNKPTYDSTVLDYAKIELNEGNVAHCYQFDITKTVKKWYEGGTNYGLMLKTKNESAVNRVELFSAEEYNLEGYPEIYVTFKNNKGIEDYWSYSTYSIGASGTAYVNDYTGNLVYELPILSSISEIMPVSVVGYYNNYCANKLIGEKDPEPEETEEQRIGSVRTSIGRGFRLNYQQTVLPSSEYGLTGTNATKYPYVYTDGDGTEHYIQKVTKDGKTTYKDESGLGITFTTNFEEEGTYRITDKAHNKYYFNNKGNLFRIKDNNGNEINIKYKSASSANDLPEKSRISQIIDGAGHTYTFTYYVKSSTGVELDYVEKITDDAGREYKFSISGGLLEKVTCPDGSITEIVYEDGNEGIINYIQTDKSYRLNFDYTSKATGRRVKTVKEYGVILDGSTVTGTTKGQVITFDRSKYNTTIMRSCGLDGIHYIDDSSKGADDIITTVQFDNMGRAISQQTKYGSGDEIGAGSVAYTTSDSDESASGFKNKVSGSGATGKYVENLLYGGNAESTSGWNFTKSGTITASEGTSSASRYIGKKSIKLTVDSVGSENARCYFRQNYTDNIKSNTEYTLSAYVKTGDLTAYSDASLTGAFIQIIGYDSNGNSVSTVNSRSQILTERTDLDVNEGWRRLSCTVTTTDDIVSLRCYLFLRNTKGSVCFDGIQLEKGATVNDYNMLENSHFTMVSGNAPLSWSESGDLEFSTGSTVSNGVKTTEGTTGSNTKAMIITGAPNALNAAVQTVTVEGNPDDTYILSGWGKANAVNSTFHTEEVDEETTPTALFEIGVRVNYSVSDGTTVYQYKPSAKFNTSISDWQCASVPIALKYTGGESGKTYTPTSIRIILKYKNQENFAYFDKIMLVKDVASSYTYDDDGNVISAASNAEQKANMKYEDNNLTSYTDTAGFTTTLSYDNNNVTLVKSAKGVYTDYDYDSHGNVTNTEIRNKEKSADATASIRTTNSYNSKIVYNGVTINAGAYKMGTRDQNGNETSYAYDLKTGTLVGVTNAKNVETNYEYYKTFGKQKSVTTGGSKVSYVYNNKQMLDKITFGNTTKEEYSFKYDNFGNVTQTLVGSQPLSTNTYRARNGALESTLYGNGDARRYMYNNLGQLRRVYSTDGNASERLLYSWAYNDSGVTTAYVDRENEIKILFDYDSLGRLSKSETQDRTEGTFIGSAEYGYDIRNNLTNLTTKYGGQSFEQKYSYSENSLNSNSASYQKDNLPTVYQLYDTRYATYSYDGLNRLNQRMFSLNTPLYYNYIYKSSDRNATGETLYRTTQVSKEFIGNDVYVYGYDVLGNVTSVKKATRSGDSANSTSYTGTTDYVSYTYDNLGQLTRENNKLTNKTITWTYDELGNIAERKEYAYTTEDLANKTATKTVAYTYTNGGKTTVGWNNLLTSVDLDGDGVGANDSITYDAIGNPTTYLGATLTWNGRELTSYTKGNTAITYEYDADGLRASKTVNGAKTKYYYVNGKLHYEERGDGTKLYYFYDSNGYLSGINHNGTNYYPATNLKGDVVAIYRHTGALWATYEYDAWGNVIAIKDASGNAITDETHVALANPIRYRGYYYDSETELYYLQSRYYNAKVGRFLNADGFISTGDGVLGYNMFAYCGNNPVMFSDPSGNSLICAILGIVVAVVCVVGLSSCSKSSGNAPETTSPPTSPSSPSSETKQPDLTKEQEEDKNNIALTIYGEQHGTSYYDDWKEGQEAVAWTIINRYNSSSYPSDWTSIVTAEQQFTGYSATVDKPIESLDPLAWDYANVLAENMVTGNYNNIQYPNGFTDKHVNMRTDEGQSFEDWEGIVRIAGNVFFSYK